MPLLSVMPRRDFIAVVFTEMVCQPFLWLTFVWYSSSTLLLSKIFTTYFFYLKKNQYVSRIYRKWFWHLMCANGFIFIIIMTIWDSVQWCVSVCMSVYRDIYVVIEQCSFLIKMTLLLFAYGLFREFTAVYWKKTSLLPERLVC